MIDKMNFNVAGHLFGYLNQSSRIPNFRKALLGTIYEVKVNYLICGIDDSLELRCLCKPNAHDFIYISDHTLKRIIGNSNYKEEEKRKEKKKVTEDIRNKFENVDGCSVGILPEIMNNGKAIPFRDVVDISLQEILKTPDYYLKLFPCFYVPIDKGIVRLSSSKTDLMINGFYGRESHVKEYFNIFDYVEDNKSKKRHVVNIKLALTRFDLSKS